MAFIHSEDILQLFANINVLKLVNLKLFAESVNLIFQKNLWLLTFLVIKKCVISRVLFFTAGLKLENYLQKFILTKLIQRIG